MDLKQKNILPMFMSLLLVSTSNVQSGVYDVTSANYGGKANSDITQALSKAWTDACASTSASKIVVPSGTYKFIGATFKGQCKAAIEFQLKDTVQAPEHIKDLPKEDTWVAFERIDGLTLSGGGTFDGQGAIASKQNDCHKNKDCKSKAVNLRFNSVTNSIIRDITTKDSKNFHVNLMGCKNLSVNTDGIHMGRSSGINITDTTIGTGDDCISIGHGTNQPHVTNVKCGPGHGISIGSLGRTEDEEPVSGIFIKNCTITNTDNGVRIKTWPASPAKGTVVSDVHFEDIIMDNVKNPLVSSKVKISDVSFKNIRGSSSGPVGIKLLCSGKLPCENVKPSDIDLTYTGDKGSITSDCKHVKPTINNVAKPLACATSS
ncbi:exopolygalacturonase-like [Pyrus ussuriensis x Pyrus communis]|uniref:Exopolygalacturonase-like n=1 Tax=Pyrus ussuriensis x Pyrus communis TaxID=2448454 RepID=A0A5N5GDF3_9ROSA|nr:exopolygalacturonase-like [Pyrus ussuriensis x Pyrus communis]